MKEKIEFTSIDEMENIPEVIYKYRDWGNPYHRRILTHREVYFAAPSSFEDPLDCKFPIRYDLLTEQQAYIMILRSLYESNPGTLISMWEEEAKRRLINHDFRNPQIVNKYQARWFHEYDNRAGILCLTTNNTSDEMWAKYT